MFRILYSLVRRTAATASLAQILVYLPLTLDIAGKDGFLALSAFLAIYYFLTSTLHLIVRNTPLAVVSKTLYSFQFLVVPSLLICALNLWTASSAGTDTSFNSSSSSFSFTSSALPSPSASSGLVTSGIGATLKFAKSKASTFSSSSSTTSTIAAAVTPLPTITQRLFQCLIWSLKHLPRAWETFLSFWSPVFMIFEGISTLLVIQSIGQIARFFIEERGESYAFLFLLTSSTTYVITAFSLRDAWRYASRESINATLIGVCVTSVAFLSAIGFATKRTSVVEASLMMAYTVFQLYYLSDGLDPISFVRNFKPPSPPLPPLILQSSSAVVYFLSHTLGQGIDFLQAACSALPLPVIVGLIYRIVVLYLASRVVVAIKRANGDDEGTRLSEEEPLTRAITVLLGYSRVIFIAVYTHLILLENQGHHIWWRWFNIILTITLWGIELLIAKEEDENDAVVIGLRLKDA